MKLNDRFLKVVTIIPVFFLSLFGFSQHTKVVAMPTTAPVSSVSNLQKSSFATTSKKVALTFDDGPYGTSTAQVIDILQRERVPATFFLVGQNVKKYPELTQKIVHNGYAIGNHTYTHAHLESLSLADSLAQIAETEATIASTTGVHTPFFRPPYGVLPSALRARLIVEGYKIVLWNVDPRDWDSTNSTSEKIVLDILKNRTPQMIIDLHDGRDTHVNYPRNNLIAALPIVIEALKADGYTFVTIDQIHYPQFF